MKKGDVTWEFVLKLILGALILAIVIGIFILGKDKLFSGENNLLLSLQNLFRLR